jgi:hypothetical protein
VWNEREKMLHDKHDEEAAKRIIKLEKLVQALTENATPSKVNRSLSNHFGLSQKPPISTKER